MGIDDRVDRISELMERLIQQEEMYETFLNSSPWGILVVDKSFRIVFVNKTFERMSGYSVGEIVGNSIHCLMPKEDAKKHVPHEKAYVKNPHDRQGNHGLKPRVKRKDGSLLPVEISLSPTKVHGQTFYFASIRPMESLFNTVEGKEKEV